MDEERKECFVIMPISDCDGYKKGHFKDVYKYLIAKALSNVGLEPKRADDVKESNLIPYDIVSRILKSSVLICDLSSKNPNVLYELGLCHAFQLPVVLIKDDATDSIFDIHMSRYLSYPKDMNVGGIEVAIDDLTKALKETIESKKTPNHIKSIVDLVYTNNPTEAKKQELESLIKSEIKEAFDKYELNNPSKDKTENGADSNSFSNDAFQVLKYTSPVLYFGSKVYDFFKDNK